MLIYNSIHKFVLFDRQKQKARLTEQRILQAYSQRRGLEMFNPDEKQKIRKSIYFRQMDKESQFHSHGL